MSVLLIFTDLCRQLTTSHLKVMKESLSWMYKNIKLAARYQDHFPETQHSFLSGLIILHGTNQSRILEVSAPSTEQLTADFKRFPSHHSEVDVTERVNSLCACAEFQVVSLIFTGGAASGSHCLSSR